MEQLPFAGRGIAPLCRQWHRRTGRDAVSRLHRMAAIARRGGRAAVLAGAVARWRCVWPDRSSTGNGRRQRTPRRVRAHPVESGHRGLDDLCACRTRHAQYRDPGGMGVAAAALHRRGHRVLRCHHGGSAGRVGRRGAGPGIVHQYIAGHGPHRAGAGGRPMAARLAGPEHGIARVRAHAALPDPALGPGRLGRVVRHLDRVRELPRGRGFAAVGRDAHLHLGEKRKRQPLSPDPASAGAWHLAAGFPARPGADPP
ncbi:hypothetical protein ACAN107058_22690 [Paracidovorax anthurii]